MKVVDLFAGAGGFSFAAQKQGCELLAAIEIDKDSCRTYQANIIQDSKTSTQLYERDILTLQPSQLLDELKLETGTLDLLVGGPPCQGFSTHRFKDQGVDDPRNKLLLRYFDFVEALKPKVFLVENVSGLLWERHKLYLTRFMKLAKKLGYNVNEPKLVDAKDYGVPQNRKRVFILGIRNDLPLPLIEWPPAPTHFSPKTGAQPWNTAATVFEKPPQKVLSQLAKEVGEETVDTLEFGLPLQTPIKDPSAISMKHSPELIKRFADTKINGSRGDNPNHVLKCHQNGYKGHKDVYGRVKLAQPGATITTGCNNPSKGRFLHPWKNHGITLRHAARFQTFPDTFVFKGGSISQARQIGNAVPIALGEVMINTCKQIVEHANTSTGAATRKQA